MVFGGGIIPEADRRLLAEMGVAHVFTPGATMADIVDLGARQRSAAAPLSDLRPGSGTATH